MTGSVAVLGGGIAGLTAAHELAGRGLEVTIYETRGGGARGLGGKARSQYFDVRGVEVPGEHGFRFMPAFYWCLPETMSRIPLRGTPRPEDFREPCADSVADSLVGLEHMAIARENFPLLELHRNVPRLRELPGLSRTLRKAFHSISPADARRVTQRIAAYLTRGPIERRHVYEKQSFWDFVGGDDLQPIAQRLMHAFPQSLVAMRADEGNARTLLDVLTLMMLDFGRPGASEWVLPGPTTDAWLAPWARWLRRLGVRFEQGPDQHITRLEVADGQVVEAHRAGAAPIRADAFVLATPLEGSWAILARSPEAVDACAQLSKIANFPRTAARPMIGMQFLLARDRPWVRGHIAFADSPWGITGVSQRQFWAEEHVEKLRAAGGEGMVSLIATEWGQPRDCESPVASRMSKAELQAEILRQVSKCRDADQLPMLRSENIVAFHVDDDVTFGTGGLEVNHSPLLIHPPGIWEKRPSPASDLHNLVLCGDYIQNPMDLATMEGASASARMAANLLLDAVGHDPADRVPVVDDYQRLHVPRSMRLLQRANDAAFQRRSPLEVR